MRYYVRPVPWVGRAIHRLAEALERYAPEGIEIVTSRDATQGQFLHVIGAGCPSFLKATDYVVWQHCYLTAGGYDYLSLWRGAKAVFSCYDLPALTGETLDNFRQVPLGYEPESFHTNLIMRKKYLVTTTGYVAATEFIDKIFEACQLLGGDMVHVGGDFKWGKGYINKENVADDDMRAFYQGSYFVAGLLEHEGFELPLLEGLACGTPVIALDLPCYRQWFNGYAVYWVKPDEPIVPQLVRIMQNPLDRRVDCPPYTWQQTAKMCWDAILS